GLASVGGDVAVVLAGVAVGDLLGRRRAGADELVELGPALVVAGGRGVGVAPAADVGGARLGLGGVDALVLDEALLGGVVHRDVRAQGRVVLAHGPVLPRVRPGRSAGAGCQDPARPNRLAPCGAL